AGTPALCLLGFLADDDLVGVLHTLALVGLGRPETADLRCNLADLLLVGTGHQDFGLGRRGDGDAVRDREQDRMREAQGQVQVLALHRGTVADADQLELALEALGDAVHHVAHDRADGAGDRHVLRLDRGEHDVAVLDLEVHALGAGHGQGALGTLDADLGVLDVDVDALGQGNRLLGNTGHAGFSAQATKHRTSPPTPCWRACASVMMPLEVEMMAMPRPLSTLGRSSLPRYWRRPEREKRCMCSMTGLPS